MAPSLASNAAATRKPHLNVVIDGMKRKKMSNIGNLRAEIHARRPSLPAQGTVIDHGETWSTCSDTSTWTTGSDESDFDDEGFSDSSSTTPSADNCAADCAADWGNAAKCECTGANGEVVEFRGDSEATHQPSDVDQIAPLGSLDMYWSSWESELLQSECWGCDTSEDEEDEDGI
jgi:hypothetical protein